MPNTVDAMRAGTDLKYNVLYVQIYLPPWKASGRIVSSEGCLTSWKVSRDMYVRMLRLKVLNSIYANVMFDLLERVT